jgi:hypothetical protein
VGYVAGADLKNGVFNGVLVEFIVKLLMKSCILVSMGPFLGLTNEMISYLIYVIIFYAISGSITGFIGSLIKRSRTPKGDTTSD